MATSPPQGLREAVPLAPLTTLRLGGAARWYLRCTSEDEVRQGLAWARESGIRTVVLGGGSNVVVPDEGLDALVLHVGLGSLDFVPVDGKVEIRAGAGVEWEVLVREAVARGLAGVECLSGIPGTVGGTPIQNVGAYGQEVSETITAVRAIDRASLAGIGFSARECGFAYRASRFKGADRDRFVVTEVRFQLSPDGAPALRYPELARAVSARGGVESLRPDQALARVRETVLELRRSKSMVLDDSDPNTRSAGSFFLNPVLTAERFADLERRWRQVGRDGPIPTFPADGGIKVPAAWLVEQAGFARGHRRGGAMVSTRHTLALVNAGGTTGDLLGLAGEIQAAVEQRFGVRLEREPVVLAR